MPDAPPTTPAAAPPAPAPTPAVTPPPSDGAAAPPAKPQSYKTFADAFREGMRISDESNAAGEPVQEKEKPRTPDQTDKNGQTPSVTTTKPFAPTSDTKPTTPDDTPPEVKSEEGKKSWKTWKEEHHKVVKERDALRTRSAEIEGQLSKLKAAAIDPARIEDLRRENDELNMLLRRVRLQEHPEFKARFDKPLDAAIARAKQVVAADKAPVIDVLLRQPWSEGRAHALDELMGELSPSRASALGKAAEDALASIEARTEAMKDEQGYAARIQAREAEQAQVRQAEAQQFGENIYRHTLARVLEPDGGLPLFQVREGQDDHNRQAQEAIDEAKQILLGDNKPEQLAEAAFWAAYGKRVHPLLRRAESEITKLQKQLDSLTAAKPKSGSASVDGTPPKPRTFAQAVKEAMSSDQTH